MKSRLLSLCFFLTSVCQLVVVRNFRICWLWDFSTSLGIVRVLSGCCQGVVRVVRVLSGCCKGVVLVGCCRGFFRVLLGCCEGNVCQGLVRVWSGSCQGLVRVTLEFCQSHIRVKFLLKFRVL